MRTAWAMLFAALACVTAFAAPPEPEPVSLHARVSGGHLDGPAVISIAPDGAATVELSAIGTPPRRERIEIAFRLAAAEMDDLRRLIAESRFFGEWGPKQRTSQPRWDVTATLGARELRRDNVDSHPEFEPLQLWLWRFEQQARTVVWIREGRAVWVADKLERDDERARLIRPDDLVAELVPALVRAIASAERPQHAYDPARYLLRYAPAADWPKRAAEVLAATEDDRRHTVLGAWLTELTAPGRAAQRAAFAPMALAEAQAPWASGTKLSDGNTHTLRRLLAFALRARTPGALAAAADRARALSTFDRTFFPWDDDGLGADGIALGVRLLEDPEPAPRLAGARLLRAIADKARRLPKGPAEFDVLISASTFVRLRADAVPALERHAKTPGESLRVREECFDALTACAGRDPEAERRAANAAESARRQAQWRARDEQHRAEAARHAEAAAAEAAKHRRQAPPKGELSISGRVLGPHATPLEGFVVIAWRDEGPPPTRRLFYGRARTAADGSFRIDGLVAGEFSLVAADPQWTGRLMPDNSTLIEDVAAGSTGVDLTFIGSMLRGRVVGADGRPLAQRTVRAQMRDTPDVPRRVLYASASSTQTDAEGRFLLLQLNEGVYDIEVPYAPKLEGASAIDVSSPEEITIRVVDGDPIRGRVVDETGAPLPGAVVWARPEGSPGRGTSQATTRDDGTFRVIGLDASRRYVVGASFAALTFDLRSERNVESVVPDGGAVELLIDTSPRLAVRVDFGQRGVEGQASRMRLVRDGDEASAREFEQSAVLWRAAPEGTWRVYARVRDLDESGARIDRWMELGTVRTGEPERTFSVPR